VLCEAVGVSRKLLPEVFAADHVSGGVTKEASGRLGLTSGHAGARRLDGHQRRDAPAGATPARC